MKWIGLLCCLGYLAPCGFCQDSRGIKSFELLNATSAAPVGAHGTFDIDGTSIILQVYGLKPGQYQIAASTNPGAQPLVLTLFNIPDLDLVPSTEAGGNNRETSGSHQTDTLSFKARIQLPENWKLTRSTQLLVRDPGGIVFLHSGPTNSQPTAGTAAISTGP